MTIEIKDIVACLRRELGLNEAPANERAHAMMATITSKHPRLKLTAVVVDRQTVTICLANGTQVKFDPTMPVAVWKYPEGKRTAHPKARERALSRDLYAIEELQNELDNLIFTDKDANRKRIQAILMKHGVKTIQELEEALRIEVDRNIDEELDLGPY